MRFALGLLLALAAATPALADPIAGRASVIDGDTIEIHGTRIRISGIDAPESRQTCKSKENGEDVRCGQRAAFWLSDQLAAHVVTCSQDGEDRYHRVLAHCEVAGQDVAAEMVRAGWALAFVRYSREYEPQEVEARSSGSGLWAYEFVPPWAWRKGER